MAALPPDHDLSGDETITQFRMYRSRYRRCSLCVIPAIIKGQIFEKWHQAATDEQPFTVADVKSIISKRCGDCSSKGWPKVSVEGSTLFLHVASSDRRKMK